MRILMVEDSHVARLAQTQFLKMCNCEVDKAINGAEMLKKINAKHYDLIFMGIGLPDTDGFKLTKIIRSNSGENQKVPIIAITAYEDVEH